MSSKSLWSEKLAPFPFPFPPVLFKMVKNSVNVFKMFSYCFRKIRMSSMSAQANPSKPARTVVITIITTLDARHKPKVT